MPYHSIDDLPNNLQNLPKHAKEIYKRAFNSAYQQYPDEVTVHKVAWSAVKKNYIKNKMGKWIKRS